MEDYEGKIERMLSRWSQKQQVHKRGNNGPGKAAARAPHYFSIDKEGEVVEHARALGVLAKCKVLVCGGGPSGLCAAIGAARALKNNNAFTEGDVILIEKYNCLGGCITTVGMESLAWFRYDGCVPSSGIGIEMERVASNMGASTKWPYNESPCLDADYFKIVADDLVTQAGVKVILHCYAAESIVVDGVIRGVVTESKSGRHAIVADRVCDCTGDGDIAFMSGVDVIKNPVEQMMGTTPVFSVSGVNIARFRSYTDQNYKTYKDWNEGEWDQETTGKEDNLKTPFFATEFKELNRINKIKKHLDINVAGSWSALSEAGEATNLNLVHIRNIDGTNVMDLTKAEMFGRREALNALMTLKSKVPGFEKAKLRNFGMTIGVRDTRKIVSKYYLTGKDVTSMAKFQDSIGIFPEFLDGYNILVLPTTGRYFQVPLGACIPKRGTDNLIVGGRCVGGDMISHTATRNMMCCCVTGQGVGVAAAISLLHNQNIQDLNLSSGPVMQEIQAELRTQGVRLD